MPPSAWRANSAVGAPVELSHAIGATLVSVIATSSGAASAFLKKGFSNIRIGMFLEIATTLGAITGGLLAARIPTSALGAVFGLVLVYFAFLSTGHKRETHENTAGLHRPGARSGSWAATSGIWPGSA